MAPLRVTGRRLPRTLVAQETLDEATTVQFPGLGGVVPERFVAPALTCAQCGLAIRRRHGWRAYLALADRYCAKGLAGFGSDRGCPPGQPARRAGAALEPASV
jgi:hypothetical protein